MVVFCPFKRPVNPFLNEIERFFSGTFIFDHYSKLHEYENIDIIHIHWPEVLFNSRLPNKEEFKDFIKHFFLWKKDYKIVFTLHNLKPHISKSDLYPKLYEEISNNVDAVVHFANTSINAFKDLYPHSKAEHVVISHPLYLRIPNKVNRQEARAFLKIKDNYKVVLVFGHIRTNKERQFVFNTFKKLKLKDKFLIVSTVGKFKPKLKLGWKISSFTNNYLFKKYNSKSNYIVKNARIKNEEIQYYFNAADVVLIPRENSLNSGVLYLAISFNKKVVAPNLGNIGEVALSLNQKVFEVSNCKSAAFSLEKMLLENNETNILTSVKDIMHPAAVAKKHEELYLSLLQ